MTIPFILDLPVEAEQFIKTQAASQEKSPEEFVLQAIGFHMAASASGALHEYTTDDFNQETLESIRQGERGELTRCNNLDELHNALGI